MCHDSLCCMKYNGSLPSRKQRDGERERDVPVKPSPIFYLWPTGSPSVCPLDDTQEVSTTHSHQNTSRPDQSLTVKWGVVSGDGCCWLWSSFVALWCLVLISPHPSLIFLPPFPSLSLSSPKIHQDSHRPDRSIRRCSIICVPSHRQSQALCLLEQEGQEGQLPAYRGGCHSAQCSTPTVTA